MRFLIGCLFFVPVYLHATHIVGGEITYKCLGGNFYEIKLTVYRDCYNGVPAFDNPAVVGVYDADWNLVKKLEMGRDFSSNDTIPVILSNPCLIAPPNVCVHRTVYRGAVFLPFKAGGYTIVYQRCCRNKLIRNLPDPLNTGISFIAELSEKTLLGCNSSAVFNSWPPVAICIHEPIDFDHAASDPNGDSLAYRLCTPRIGPDSMTPTPNPPFPGPYQELEWLDPPYNLTNLLGGDPVKIDPQTGFITGIPNLIGNYVVGVCVDEYRNGTLISTTRRDFQYNVADCGKPFAAFFTPKAVCDTLSLQLDNQSESAKKFQWYFDWPQPEPSSTETNPLYTWPDTGSYQVALIAEPGDPCSDTIIKKVFLTQSYLTANFDLGFPDCADGILKAAVTDQSVDSLFGIVSWQWVLKKEGEIIGASSAQAPQFSIQKSGVYTLTLTAESGNGCTETREFTFAPPYPPLDQLADTLAVCQGDSAYLYPQANPAFDYQWSPAEFLTDDDVPNPLAFPPADQTWSVTVSGNGPCVLKKDVTALVLEPDDVNASADPEKIPLGGSSQLIAEGPGLTTFIWTPAATLDDPDIYNPLATPEATTTYWVEAATAGKCVLRDSVVVYILYPGCEEPYIFFPTGFSPNGDGMNDVLKLEGHEVESVYWAVYNRWGEQLFEARSMDDAWDGTWNGREQPVETYGYILEVNCPGGKKYFKKGNVSLLR